MGGSGSIIQNRNRLKALFYGQAHQTETNGMYTMIIEAALRGEIRSMIA